MSSLLLNRQKRPLRVFLPQLISIFSLTALSLSANADNAAEKFKNAFMGDQPIMNASAEQHSGMKTRGISLNKTKAAQASADNFGNDENGCMARTKSVALKINFQANSKNIQNPAEIAGIADSMNSSQLADCYFIVEGHTDATGNDYYNLWLSQQRAEQVKQYLRQNNVDENRLIVVGKGEDELINRAAPNDAENRRVVFKVVNYSR